MTIINNDENSTDATGVLPYRIVPELNDEQMTPMRQKMDDIVSQTYMFYTKRNIIILYSIITLISFMLLITLDNGPSNIITFAILNGVALATALYLTSATLSTLIITAIINGFIYKFNSGFNKYAILISFIALFIVSAFVLFVRGAPSKNLNTATNLECTYPIWGEAGKHVGENNDFGDAGVVGAKGEKIVGDALAKLTQKYPHVRIFNGVKFIPYANKPWDVDHVAIIGHNVYFIDSKFWSIGDYSWNINNRGEKVLFKNGEWWKPGEVHMDGAMEKWVNYLGNDVELFARITLAQPERKNNSYTIDNQNAPNGQAVTTTKRLINELSIAAENSEKIVDRYLIHLFKNNMHNN